MAGTPPRGYRRTEFHIMNGIRFQKISFAPLPVGRMRATSVQSLIFNNLAAEYAVEKMIITLLAACSAIFKGDTDASEAKLYQEFDSYSEEDLCTALLIGVGSKNGQLLKTKDGLKPMLNFLHKRYNRDISLRAPIHIESKMKLFNLIRDKLQMLDYNPFQITSYFSVKSQRTNDHAPNETIFQIEIFFGLLQYKFSEKIEKAIQESGWMPVFETSN